MKILLIETATQICSVVLAEDGKVIARRDSDIPNAHSTRLSVFIGEVLKECGLTPRDLGAVGVSAGPGSYTGLRIGVSTAKGFCYALGIPLVSVPTLLSMAALYYRQHPDYHGFVCPMIDARRMECYTAFYGPAGEVRGTQADIIDPGIYDEYLDKGPVTFIGDGAAKTQPLLGGHLNARYDLEQPMTAVAMWQAAARQLRQGRGEDVAYYEPFYLKDFVAKKSVVRGLRD